MVDHHQVVDPAFHGLGQGRHVEGAGGEEECQDPDQHEGAAENGEYEELHGRVVSAAAPPNGDEKEHGHQLQLPEEEEQEEV